MFGDTGIFPQSHPLIRGVKIEKRMSRQEICKKQNASFFQQLTAVYFIFTQPTV
jgi:hypothetical protein